MLMKFRSTLALGLLLVCYVIAAWCSILSANEQPFVSNQRELGSLRSGQFTRISHPAFQPLSVRIKKSDFCDGGVNAYTGYIDIGPRHLFFYFFESRNDPRYDDVLLWTNGGPGASSSMGLFMELGPCTIATTNNTVYNPHSWNSNANIFFIDQPVDVGFSYADFGETVSSTEEAAEDIAAFVALFFETFSSFKGRNFHLAGESFAGRYLPVYATAIYERNAGLIANGLTPINLKSILIGNGATNNMYLTWSWYDLQCTKISMAPVQTIRTCVRMKEVEARCRRWTQTACITHFDNIDCNAAFDFCWNELLMPFADLGYNVYDMSKKCDNFPSCYREQELITEFLNQPWVREEIGIDPSFGNYSLSSPDVAKAFHITADGLFQNELYISALLERGVKVLIYVGTYDLGCNWIGNEIWTMNMDWSGGRSAGKVRAYGNFTFLTIYGAGHLVPHDKPTESLDMLDRWLSDESF